MRNPLLITLALAITTTTLFGQAAMTNDTAAASATELAKKLQNPVANLVSVPIQNNWDFGIGPANAMKYTANVQPVIPFSLNEDWNLITRTIVPIIYAESPIPGGSSTSGLGDITQSFFLSPKEPVGGWILGAGPVFLYPSATDTVLGSGKFGLGPTIVALQQKDGWTYGALFNHIWSVAGPNGRADVNATFLQPFVSYTTKMFTTFAVNTESSYNWEASQWTVPLNFSIQQLIKIGKQPVAFQLGYRYYAERPAGGPDWGLRFAVTLLFPK
ncbi:MAG: transporter [Opitutaceae bacterium]|nr:transporter [Verrucomicrobiales bacterium]